MSFVSFIESEEQNAKWRDWYNLCRWNKKRSGRNSVRFSGSVWMTSALHEECASKIPVLFLYPCFFSLDSMSCWQFYSLLFYLFLQFYLSCLEWFEATWFVTVLSCSIAGFRKFLTNIIYLCCVKARMRSQKTELLWKDLEGNDSGGFFLIILFIFAKACMGWSTTSTWSSLHSIQSIQLLLS